MSDGSRHSLAYVLETVYGQTPATPPFKALRYTATSLGMSRETLTSDELRNDRMIPDVRGGASKIGGDLEFELSYGSFDDILEAVLCGTWGAPGADGAAVGVSRLKAAVARRSFTIERNFGDLLAADLPYHRFTGVEFNAMELAVKANALITAKCSITGQAQTLGSAMLTGATYAPAPTTSVMDSFTGSLLEGGIALGAITEISLSLENGLEPRWVVGSKNSLRPSIARSNVSGSVSAYFESGALLAKFINEDTSSIAFELPDGAGNKLTVVLPRIKYMGGQPDVGGEGPIMLQMPFQAILDPVTGTNLYIDRDPV